MTIVEITGGMLRAARSLTGLSQQELADRASISRPCLTAWEGSSGSVAVPLSHGMVSSSLDEMRERLDRVHAEAQDVIAESQWLRLKSRELRDRIDRNARKNFAVRAKKAVS